MGFNYCGWVGIHILFDWSLDKILMDRNNIFLSLLEVDKMKNGWEWTEEKESKELVKKAGKKIKEVVDEAKEWR